MKIIKLNIKTKWLPIKINSNLIEDALALAKKTNNRVLAIVPSTKPCFYKLYSVWQEAEKKKLPHILIHSGQHYDGLVAFGIKEFGYDKAFAIDLQIRGGLSQKSTELFTKIKETCLFLKKNWPNIDVVPFVSGDTVTAGIVPIAWAFATNQKALHTEAGLRGMSPKFFFKFKEERNKNIDKFIERQFSEPWLMNRSEPFPEQADTFIASSCCQYFFAPHKINKEHLIREGYPQNDIFVVGNSVVDVMDLEKNKKTDKSIFDIYPKLSDGEWLRTDIHHRGNLTEKRFKVIIGSIIDLVKMGEKIVFVELNSTRTALEHYNLRQKLVELNQRKENFLFTPLWEKYAHVVEFISSKHCWGVLTDSGSVEEEMNEFRKPCMTVRFSTERPETVIYAHSNILVPPISKEFITKIVNYVQENRRLRRQMSRCPKIYGENVAGKIISTIEKLFKNNYPMFKWAHEELEIYKEANQKFKYL